MSAFSARGKAKGSVESLQVARRYRNVLPLRLVACPRS